MKHLTLLLLTFLFSGQLFGQLCLPDSTYADSSAGVYPLPFEESVSPNGGIADTACVGEEFAFEFTIVIQDSLNFETINLKLDSLVIDSVNNLPNGLAYGCYPENCTFYPNELGCVSLYGNIDDDPGEYDLAIYGRVFSGFLTINLSFPDEELFPGKYTLKVVDGGGCVVGTQKNPLADQVKIKNFPNPFRDLTFLEIHSDIADRFTYSLYDMFGKELKNGSVDLHAGLNTIELNANNLPDGIYLYSLTDGVNRISKKLTVSKK